MVSTEELAWLGSVPRTLTLDVSNRDPGVALPASIPTDFRGDIHMAAPQLFVDVSIKNTKCSSSDDDDDDENTSSEDDGISYHNRAPAVSLKLPNIIYNNRDSLKNVSLGIYTKY